VATYLVCALLGAAACGIVSLLWLRRRSRAEDLRRMTSMRAEEEIRRRLEIDEARQEVIRRAREEAEKGRISGDTAKSIVDSINRRRRN